MPPRSTPAAITVGVGPSGLPLAPAGTGSTPIIEFFRRVEGHGYASIAVGDHLDERGAPLLMLAAAAQVTSHLALTALVLCNDFRNATVLTQEVRTLQVLSDGRFELGLGVGWMRGDFAKAGIPFDGFDARLERLADTVRTIRRELDPSPRIIVGGGGPKMLAAAGRLADVVTFNIPLGRPRSIGEIGVAQGREVEFEQRIRIVADAAAQADRSVTHHIYIHDLHIGPQWRERAEAAAAAVGLDIDEYNSSPHVLAGDAPRIADTMRERAERYDLRSVSIPGQFTDPFAPVLELLA